MATGGIIDLYRNQFDRLENRLHGGLAWTRSIRKAAISRFFELGFPTLRDEDWKYTSVEPIAAVPYALAGHRADGSVPERLLCTGLGERSENRLVFVNGYYAPEYSSIKGVAEHVAAGSLTAAMGGAADRVKPHWSQYAGYQDRAFVALNTALAQDGAFIYVPKGEVVEEPIHLLYFSIGSEEPAATHPRNLIVAEANSRAAIVESYIGVDENVYWTNAVTEIVLGENSVVEHTKLLREGERAYHLATLQTHQSAGSSFLSHSVALGAALARNDLNVVLDGEGSDCTLNGLYVVAGKQHVDHHTRVDHVKPQGTSRELYKGVLDGRSRGVFNGKIYVHSDARGTDARQTNKNLLLSKEATIDTKPQLEIYNNDVKCTHGSSIGQLDPDALFYLRSRGIELEAARALLTYAFASEVLSGIRVGPIRNGLEETVRRRLRQEGSPGRAP